MTKIVIADDHRVVRSGLRMVLDREEDFEVVAEAGSHDVAGLVDSAAAWRASSRS